jgi:5-methylcytosine-specific restriction protein A
MPYVPLRPCTTPGCPNLTARARCTGHQRRYEQARGTPTARGYGGATWQRLRARVLREEPTCAACGADGQPDDHVDHVVPMSHGGTSTRENLQRLCPSCNGRKARRETR